MKSGGDERVHLMAALDHTTGTVIGQVDVGVKTNEITRFDSLLEILGDLEGKISPSMPCMPCMPSGATLCSCSSKACTS